ncbi:MAG: glycosyltransferase family 2 protein [Clostridiales bacterium]|nr:glycosyltransferase family 2 protein [Clostridiales bacterium]
MQPLVSVIMPVYNVRPFLSRAVDSLLAQTFTDFQLLLVDDGSTDGSGALCDQYGERDGRILVLHQPNGGAPAARNRGMETAAGRYFYFMDGDDWAEPDMLEKLTAAAEQTGAQLAIAGFYIDTLSQNGALMRQTLEAGEALYTCKEDFRRAAAALFDKNMLYPPWNKLYRAEYLKERGILFPHTFWDDFPFNLAVIRDVERVCVLPCAGYHFMRERPESETARFQPGMYEKREEEHGWMLELYRHWGLSDDPAAEETIARRYAERVVGCIENLTGPASPVTGQARRSKVRTMLQNPRLRESLRLARPRTLLLRCMLLPLRLKWTAAAVLMGKCISRVKTKNLGLFARLKANR